MIPTPAHNPVHRDLSLAEANQRIQDTLTPLTEQALIPLQQALGRVLSQQITAPQAVPNHDNSAMDGYAVNSQGLTTPATYTLPIVGTAFAGQPFSTRVAAGTCVRIMTGSVMPEGCDSVILQEQVTTHAQHITFTGSVSPGQNRRLTGEDLQLGQAVFMAGHRLKPADIGLLASLGIAHVMVYRPLRVAFFSTGDELSPIGAPLPPGQIYDSNRYTLHALLNQPGIETIDLGAIADDPEQLQQALTTASAHADVILTSGGVSVGEADYMKDLLAQTGEVVFWKLAIKPGRPLAFGKLHNKYFFGLPGNPVSVMVTFYQVVRPALHTLMGYVAPTFVPELSAICTESLRKSPGRREFQRGILSQDESNGLCVTPTGNQSSGVLSSMSQANCFIVLDETCTHVPSGDRVTVQLFDSLMWF